MKVGFIGLGSMGSAMARNLLKAGHEVTVYNRTLARAEELTREGARVVATPVETAAGEVVITMLADDHALEDVLLGSGDLLARLRSDRIHASMRPSRRTTAASSRSGSMPLRASPRGWGRKTCVWSWPPPMQLTCPCPSPACCTTVY